MTIDPHPKKWYERSGFRAWVATAATALTQALVTQDWTLLQDNAVVLVAGLLAAFGFTAASPSQTIKK